MVETDDETVAGHPLTSCRQRGRAVTRVEEFEHGGARVVVGVVVDEIECGKGSLRKAG